MTIGFIYVGPKDDYGYNQAHALGAASVAKLPGVKVVEEASVPETVAVQETMRDMIVQDNATVLFPTSFGYYDPHILKVAKQFPKIQFSIVAAFIFQVSIRIMSELTLAISMRLNISPGSLLD